MPLKRMLEEGRSFGPKAVALLLEAFDGIVAELDLRSAPEPRRRAPRKRRRRFQCGSFRHRVSLVPLPPCSGPCSSLFRAYAASPADIANAMTNP